MGTARSDLSDYAGWAQWAVFWTLGCGALALVIGFVASRRAGADHRRLAVTGTSPEQRRSDRRQYWLHRHRAAVDQVGAVGRDAVLVDLDAADRQFVSDLLEG